MGRHMAPGAGFILIRLNLFWGSCQLWCTAAIPATSHCNIELFTEFSHNAWLRLNDSGRKLELVIHDEHNTSWSSIFCPRCGLQDKSAYWSRVILIQQICKITSLYAPKVLQILHRFQNCFCFCSRTFPSHVGTFSVSTGITMGKRPKKCYCNKI